MLESTRLSKSRALSDHDAELGLDCLEDGQKQVPAHLYLRVSSVIPRCDSMSQHAEAQGKARVSKG